MTKRQKLLLIAMPYLHPTSTSLALGLLSEILVKEDLPTDCLHGSLLYPRTPLWDTDAGVRFLINYGGLLFGAYLAQEVEAFKGPFLEFMCQDYANERIMHGLNLVPGINAPLPQAEVSAASPTSAPAAARPAWFSREQVAQQIAGELVNAGVCLDRCFERASDPGYDVVGFSITFFTQLPASLALALRLKAKNPAVKIVFGGSGCVGEQAEGMMRSFPVIDAVCYTEADDVIAALIRALRGEGDLDRVHGIVYRDKGGALHRTSEPLLRRDMDSLPLPNHEAYFAQHAHSEWSDLKPILFFETSRGCWWGQKHLCTFCGLSERELAFRSKSPGRLFEEIQHLYHRYPSADYLHPTDDILDTRYFTTLLPELARMQQDKDRPLRLFFEVKSNMRAAHLLLLARAGVTAVQPGIESFSDEILRLMDKGTTGLDQVQFIKWATQAGVGMVYNMLVRNPGEGPEAYREMSELLPFLRHLPPPSSVVITELERFSPYFKRAQHFGITRIVPKAYHKLVFPMAGVDLDAIAYRFDYDHPCKHDAALIAAQREFVALVQRWRREYRPSSRYYCDRGDHIVLIGGTYACEVLAGSAADLFRYLDSHRSFAAICRKFPHLEPSFLRAQLAAWRHKGIVFGSRKDEHLALLPRFYEKPMSLEEILAACKPAKGPGPAKALLPIAAPLTRIENTP